MKRCTQYIIGNCLIMLIAAGASFVGKNILFPQSFSLISPEPRDVIFDKLIHKLEKNENIFSLHDHQTIIAQAQADTIVPYENANAYIAFDNQTGEIIENKNADQPVAIASLTKIMTAIVSLDLANPQDIFTVQADATHITPTIIGVVQGQKMTLNELLHAMLMTSANDAAQVIKDGVDGKYKEQIFIHAMNEKARYLGLTHTHFSNAQGFDDSQNYSSARDLAILTHYALVTYPFFSDIVKIDYLQLAANQYHKQFDLYNWNGLLDVYPNIYGVKIGNTSAAGSTMIVGSKREGKNILVVLLGTPGILQREVWASQLLDDAFQKQFGFPPVKVTVAQLQKKYGTWKYGN